MSYCSDLSTCSDGNCIGCKNGEPWCQDPRCAPYCAPTICIYPEDEHDFNVNIVMALILVCLLAILFVVWFIYGPQLFVPHDNHQLANVIN